MMPRTPHCEFALRFDQAHPGIEVVILRADAGGISVKNFGHLVSAPMPSSHWFDRDFIVKVRQHFYGYAPMTYRAQGLGLLPKIETRGWCTHFTQDHIDKGIYTTTEVHHGRDCPNFYKEVTWGDTFTVKFKHAHRVLGCKPWETRALLNAYAREVEELRELEMLEASQAEDDLG